jgi:hypothetical protein
MLSPSTQRSPAVDVGVNCRSGAASSAVSTSAACCGVFHPGLFRLFRMSCDPRERQTHACFMEFRHHGRVVRRPRSQWVRGGSCLAALHSGVRIFFRNIRKKGDTQSFSPRIMARAWATRALRALSPTPRFPNTSFFRSRRRSNRSARGNGERDSSQQCHPLRGCLTLNASQPDRVE